jgi:hypothetical protein
MCAAPMGMMAAGDRRTDGDALAAWAEGRLVPVQAVPRNGVGHRSRARFQG